jgi:hypothetical protein
LLSVIKYLANCFESHLDDIQTYAISAIGLIVSAMEEAFSLDK